MQAPIPWYGSRRGRVARRRKRKFYRSGVIQKADQVHLVLGSARADFSKPSISIVSLVPTLGFVRNHRVVVATEPIGTGNTSVSRSWETSTFLAEELALCRPDPC